MTIEERSCTLKLRYPSKPLAEQALTAYSLMPGGRAKRSYYCEFCNGWHLSSHMESEKRTRKIDRVVRRLKKKGRIPCGK